MTIKKLAELLGVSRQTVLNAKDKLKIEPVKVGNRFEIKEDDLIEIIKFVRPTDFDKYLKMTGITNDENVKIDKNDNKIDKNNNQNAESVNQNAKNDFVSYDRLIDVLRKQLDEKQETIRHQQEQLNHNQDTIDALIKVNATLTARVAMLEDKQEPPQEPIILSEGAARESEEEPKEKRTLRDRIKAFFA